MISENAHILLHKAFFDKQEPFPGKILRFSRNNIWGRLTVCPDTMEYRYRSIPHNCSLLDSARLKPIYGEYLELYGFDEVGFEALGFRAADEDFVAYVEEAKRMREQFPGLEIRTLEFGPERNTLRQAVVDSGSRTLLSAIDGGDILGVSICSTRGEPIRFLPPYRVKQIVAELDKGIAVSPDLTELVDKLAVFYRFSAAFDEGVIAIKL